jgi:hypothetical protein
MPRRPIRELEAPAIEKCILPQEEASGRSRAKAAKAVSIARLVPALTNCV